MKGLTIGQRASLTRTFTVQDINEYRALTSDTSLCAGYDPRPAAGRPGIMFVGDAAARSGHELAQASYRWLAPAPIGTAITATVEITRLRPDKNLVNLHGTFVTVSGVVIGEGETLVGVSDLHQV